MRRLKVERDDDGLTLMGLSQAHGLLAAETHRPASGMIADGSPCCAHREA